MFEEDFLTLKASKPDMLGIIDLLVGFVIPNRGYFFRGDGWDWAWPTP